LHDNLTPTPEVVEQEGNIKMNTWMFIIPLKYIFCNFLYWTKCVNALSPRDLNRVIRHLFFHGMFLYFSSIFIVPNY